MMDGELGNPTDPRIMKNLVFPGVIALACFASCAPRSGMSVEKYTATTATAGNQVPSLMTFHVKADTPEGNFTELPSKRVKLGSGFQTSLGRAFVYPSEYEAASPTLDRKTVNPATPVDFKTVQTGVKADLTTERSGGLVIVKGNIEVTDFQGFSRIGGEIGQPILDGKGRLITENRIEMPKLATYTTPVYLAMKPGQDYSFQISHPKKGAKATLSLAPVE